MADVNASINIDINASAALAQLRALETQISNFNNSIARSNVAAAAAQKSLNDSFRAQIDATGLFNTSIRSMESNVSALGTAFDKGTLSSKQYFRYAASQMPGLANAFRGLGKEQAEMASLAESRVKQLQTRYVSLGRDINGMQRMLAIQPKTLAAGYATDIALAEQRQQLFNRALQLGSTGMVNWGKNTQWAGRQLMVGFTVPMTIAAGAAAKFFMDLEKSGVAFRRVYGDMDTTTQEAQKNLQAIQALGVEYTKYGLAVNEVIDIGARAAATGAQNDDLLAATEQTLRLATLGQTDYQTALDATISLQTAFGISSANLATTIDFLNAVENQTVLTLEDVARAVPRVAPVIKGLGGDVQDLAVFMTALREGGVSAEQGANALKSGLASLINPTDRASETLKEMGINIKAIVDANRGDLMGTVRAFGQALESVSEFERQQALEATFGKYQYARLGALFKNIARDGSQAARAMELAGMSVEDLASLSEKELSVLSESVTNKFLGAVERLKVAIAPIGEMFLKVATPIIEVVTTIANKFNELPDTVKAVIAGIVGAVGLIAPAVLMGIGLIANGIGNGLKFILLLRGGIKGLAAALTGSSRNFQYQSSAALDAAAAMSTLDGKTDALTGSLLMQEGAVNALSSAYGRLASAASGAAASMPAAFPGVPVVGRGGRGVAVVRRARGGVIPGSGNGDTVPALLTPGEFVMTKEATEKFAPVLAAMNAGSVQGFAEGGGVSQSGNIRAAALEFSHVAEKFELTDDQIRRLITELEEVGQTGSKAYRELTRVMNEAPQRIATGGQRERVYGYSNVGVPLRGDINRGLGAEGVSRSSVASAIRQSGAGSAAGIIDLLAQRGVVLDPDTERRFADTFYTAFSDGIDKLPDEIVKDANMTDPFKNAVRQAAQELGDDVGRMATSILDEEMTTISSVVTETGQAHGGTGRAAIKKGVGSRLATAYSSRRKQIGGAFSRLMGGRSMQEVAAEGVATGAATSSPSDATRQTGQDIDEGIIQGMQEKEPEVKSQGERVGKAAVQSVQDGADTSQLSLFDDIEDTAKQQQLSLFDAETLENDQLLAANREAVDERKKSNFAIRQNTDATQKHTLQVKESTTADALNENATRKNTNLQVTKTQAGATMRPSIATTGAFTPAGAAVDNESAALAAALTDQETETNAATKQTRGLKDRIRGLSGKLFGASAAFTGLTIAGSFMEGQIGQVASSLMPVAFGMDAVAGLLPMMMNPAGAVIAALAAVGGGLWFLNNQMNNVRAEAQGFADALTTSAAEVRGVAEFFGNQTLVERQKAIDVAAGAGLKPKDVAAGMEFIGSEVGQEMAKEFAMGLERQGGSQSTVNFANKLASMMLQGAVDFKQAKQIAAGLEQQLGQAGLSAKIVGQLERIVGPNGEDLKRNPLKIAAEITANEKQIVESLALPASDAISKAMRPDNWDIAKTAFVSPLAGIITQLGVDIPYITDISKNLMSFIDDDFEKATASVHAYGKAVGNTLRNAYDNLNSAIIKNQEIIENADKKDKPRLREVALREEARMRQQIADMRQKAEEEFGSLVQQNAALSKEALDGMQVAIKEMYDDPTMQMFAESIFSRTGGLDQEMRFDILLNMQTGEINPMALDAMFGLIGDDTKAGMLFNIAVESQGLDETNQFLIDNMRIEDEEVRRKFVVDFATEGDPKAAAEALGFTDEKRQELADSATTAAEQEAAAWEAYERGTGELANALREAQAAGIDPSDWLQGYIDRANDATGALIDFDAERKRILSGGPELQEGVTLSEFKSAEMQGLDTSNLVKADVSTIQEYTLALQDLAALNIKPKVDMSEISNQEELERVTKTLQDFAALPEDVQKSIDVDALQATAAAADFDINWEKANQRKDIFKAIGVDTSQANSAMQAFGISWAQFANLSDISKVMVMTYLTRYVSVFERYSALKDVPKVDIETQRAYVGAGNEVAAIEDAVGNVPGVGDTPGGGTTAPPPPGGGSGGGGGGGASEKSPADLVKEMIDDLKQQLKFLGDYKKVGDEVKSGLAQALRNAGAPEQLIADIISKGAEGIKIAKELLKDKAKKLKEVTDLMLEVTRLTFVESQRAEAANLATQTSAQIALANAGLNPAVVANMDPQQAQAVAAAYRAYQTAQRAADAAEDKSKKKRQEAARELAKARKEWEMVTDAVNKNTAAQDKNAIAQALLTAQQERQTAQNKVSAGLALAGRGFSAEQIGGMLEIEGAANQVVAYTNKIKELNNEKKRLEAKGEKNWTEEERKRYRQLERQLKKVNGDYRELLRLLGRITKEQTAVDVSSTITGMGARAVTARRQRTAQGLLMGQIPGLTYDQAESIAGDETTARAVVGSNRRVGAANRELTAAEKARDEYLAKGGKMKGEEWEEIKAKVAAARKEVKAATDEQKNLNAAIAGMVTEESALQWEGTVGAVTAEITKQQNAQKFLNMGISDQLVLSKLNGLSLEDQNYFLSLSVEEQQAFIDLLEQSIPLLDKINQSFEEIENRQRLISIQNRETADAKHGERDALEESAQLIDDAARAKQKEIDAAQDLIDIQQELNDDLQHQIDLIQRQVDLIQRQSDQLNRGLEIISQEEEKINEFYDERIASLDKVEQANQRIAQQQQDQLNLAQALSTGDIYSAVGAAQQMRASQAQFAADQARQTLEDARQKALENITVSVNGQLMKRKDIEEQIRKNEEQVYQLNQLMLPIQDQIYTNSLEIYRIQDTILEPLQAQLELINDQRAAIDENIRAWDRYYKYLEDNAVDPVTGIKFKDLAAIREQFNARMQPGVTNPTTKQAYTEDEAFAEAIAGRNLDEATTARLKTVLFRQDTSQVISPDNAAAAGEAAKKATPEVTKLKDEFVKVKDAIVALVNPIKNSGKQVDSIVKDSIVPLQESFKNAGNIVEGNNDSLLQKITNIKDFVVNDLIPEFSNLIVELNGATLAAQALQSALNAIERNITVTVTTQYVSAGAPQAAYKGGMIKGYAVGGSVFGNGSRDSVAAMLTPGEFVVRKSMVDKYGVPMLNKLNQGSLSPSYSVPNNDINYRTNTNSKSTVTTVAPVYNTYSVQINAETNASADEIANKAAMKIREMNNMSLRSARG